MVKLQGAGPWVPRDNEDVTIESGLGVPCWEAQADGVPCEVMRDCAECERALEPPAEAQPGPSPNGGRARPS